MIASSATIFPTSSSTPQLSKAAAQAVPSFPRSQSQAVLQKKHTSAIAHAEDHHASDTAALVGLRQRALRNSAQTGAFCELCGLAMKSFEVRTMSDPR
eukprot:scaffold221_cov249-Pinguiococcus_pyrenoidosus.AAC.6